MVIWTMLSQAGIRDELPGKGVSPQTTIPGDIALPSQKSYPVHRKGAWRIFVWLVLYFIYLVCHDVYLYVGH